MKSVIELCVKHNILYDQHKLNIGPILKKEKIIALTIHGTEHP